LEAAIDYLGMNGGQGEVAAQIRAGGRLNIGAMRPWVGPDMQTYITTYVGPDPEKPESYVTARVQQNATLRRDEWVRLDEALLNISESRITGVQDLINLGLTYDLGNGMASTVLEYHDVSDAMEADLTMDAVTRSPGDRVNFESVYLPLPIIHVDWEINQRVLENSRNMGNPLDTTSTERAVRKVMERREDMLFTDSTYAYANGTIYSYLNHPNRNIGSLTGAWTGLTGAQIVADVLAMKQESISAFHFGPWNLYVPTAYETTLDADYDATTPGTTIRERILKINNIEAVNVNDTLPAGSAILVQMTSDVVRLVRGMGIQNVQWQTEGQFITKYKTLTIQVPQVRADQEGNSGVTHYSV